MSFEERLEQKLSEYEGKIKKILLQQKLEKVMTLILYAIGIVSVIAIIIALNKH